MKKILLAPLMLIVCISLNFSNCKQGVDPTHLTIKNNSNFSVYYAISYSYPDTALNRITDIPHYNNYNIAKINANDGVSVGTGFLAISPITQMFFFDAKTIESTPWDSIVKHKMVLKRYQLTENDVRKANWTITYP